jgi:hypothetical protein
MAKGIHIIDQTGKVAISRPEVPAERMDPTAVVTTPVKKDTVTKVCTQCEEWPTVVPKERPTSVCKDLPASAVKKLNTRRCKRAKREAKDLGHAVFKIIPDNVLERLDVLIAILREAGMDKTSARTILRSFTDGLIAAGKEVR